MPGVTSPGGVTDTTVRHSFSESGTVVVHALDYYRLLGSAFPLLVDFFN